MTSERPILFSSPMVRAILAGQKTQARRLVGLDTLHRSNTPGYDWTWRGQAPVRSIAQQRRHPGGCWQDVSNERLMSLCPFGTPGDRLWVRETWSPDHRDVYPCISTVYRADCGFTDEEAREHRHCNYERTGERHFECLACAGFRWRPSIFMKRRDSRLTLEVTSVRVERLQDIDGHGAKAEGLRLPECGCEPCRMSATMCTADQGAYAEEFWHLWDAINSKRAPWASNPWVWVVSFKRVTP